MGIERNLLPPIMPYFRSVILCLGKQARMSRGVGCRRGRGAGSYSNRLNADGECIDKIFEKMILLRLEEFRDGPETGSFSRFLLEMYQMISAFMYGGLCG